MNQIGLEVKFMLPELKAQIMRFLVDRQDELGKQVELVLSEELEYLKKKLENDIQMAVRAELHKAVNDSVRTAVALALDETMPAIRTVVFERAKEVVKVTLAETGTDEG